MHAKHIKYQINDTVIQRNSRREFRNATSIYLVCKQSSHKLLAWTTAQGKLKQETCYYVYFVQAIQSPYHNTYVFCVIPLLVQFTTKSTQDNELFVLLIHSEQGHKLFPTQKH